MVNQTLSNFKPPSEKHNLLLVRYLSPSSHPLSLSLSLSLSFSTLFGPLEPSTQLLDDQQADGLGEGCEEGAANARGDAQRDELLRASGGQEGMVRGRCRIPFSRPYQERTSQTMGFHGFEMGLG